MSALWAAAVAAAVVLATSLDLCAVLVRSSATSSALTRRRVLRTVVAIRLALVAAAGSIAFAFTAVPLPAFAVLGAVPIVFGVAARRRRGAPEHVEVTGRPTSVVATLSLSGDDVAAWIVLLRWHPGTSTWPVAVALVLGAIAVPWLALRVTPGRTRSVARALTAAAPIAQIATGVALIVLSTIPHH